MRQAYGALLVAYPKGFRRRHGEEMAQVFADQCREERESGGAFALLLLGLRTVPDLTSTALAERGGAVGRGLAAAATARGLFTRGLFHEPRSGVGGGIALAVGLVILAVTVAGLALGGPLLAWRLPDLALGTHAFLLGAGALLRPARRPLAAALRGAGRLAGASFWVLLTWRAYVDYGALGGAGIAAALLAGLVANGLLLREVRREAVATRARGGGGTEE